MKEIKKTFEKEFVRDGKKQRFIVTVKLQDECQNKTYSFSIAGRTEIFCFGEWKLKSCGGSCEDVERFFPGLAPFLKFNGCNYLGQPTYPVVNGLYYGKQGKALCKDYLHITDEEYDGLLPAIKLKDEQYFKYQLFKLGIVDRWQKEAGDFIEFLVGSRKAWVNPYKEEEERFVLRISQEEIDAVEKDIESGKYSEETINTELLRRKEEKAQAERNEVIQCYIDKEEELRRERDIKLYVINAGLPVGSVIYYHFNKSAVFNWRDYSEQITREQYDEFIKNLDYTKLPEGARFFFGDKDYKTNKDNK